MNSDFEPDSAKIIHFKFNCSRKLFKRIDFAELITIRIQRTQKSFRSYAVICILAQILRPVEELDNAKTISSFETWNVRAILRMNTFILNTYFGPYITYWSLMYSQYLMGREPCLKS